MIDVLDSVRELHALGPDLLTEQELRELARREELRTRHQVATHYVVDLAGGRPVGLLPVYPTPSWYLPSARIDGLFGADGPSDWAVAALLGSDTTGQNLFVFRDTARAVAMLDHALATTEGYGVDLWCLPLLDDRQYAATNGRGGARYVGERFEAYLDLPPGDFSDYVMALPKQRRVQVRRERRAFVSSRLTLEELPVTASIELALLLHQVERKHGAPSTPDSEREYLRTVGHAMAGSGIALVTSLSGRPVATTILWDVGTHWRVRCWGCDYSVPEVRDAYAYFNLMFYEPISRAMATGTSRVIVGTSSVKGKCRRGALLRRLRTIGWSGSR